MPVLPPVPNAPYDQVNIILNTARIRLNDVLKTTQPVTGKLLQETEPFTMQVTNTAWRKFQQFLANLGYTRLIKEAIIPNCPVLATSDPAILTYISWFEFFDGQQVWPQPVLPRDLVFPLKVWERPTGANAFFQPMDCYLDGIPSATKRNRNIVWEWREDKLYMPGSMTAMDFKIRYGWALPDFNDLGHPRWYQATADIQGCQDAFSWYIVAEFMTARENDDRSALFTAKGEAAARLIMNRDTRFKERVNVRRQPRSGRSGYNGFNGYGDGGFC